MLSCVVFELLPTEEVLYVVASPKILVQELAHMVILAHVIVLSSILFHHSSIPFHRSESRHPGTELSEA